eukprot:CAMPEP_0117654282 /NCGR_PEP_ID=MMETSP0804-20121206/3659_1 /TAXON_ID=1074897 /ORGANISM="Tetraselmis astigmatica, Strain CCMP880" /LENGTH=423 /DNA_ID=CAMNT_0005460549 /DNA_START=1 /DNA_END=1272 /DNA_ORIENTATION=+
MSVIYLRAGLLASAAAERAVPGRVYAQSASFRHRVPGAQQSARKISQLPTPSFESRARTSPALYCKPVASHSVRAQAGQMPPPTYQAETALACKAVKLASQLCQKVQKGLDSEKQDKNDDSPVTVADYAAQAVVAWVLRGASPDGTLSMVAEEDSKDLREESGASMLKRITALVSEVTGESLTEEQVLELIDLGGSDGGPTGTHWVLDPIDGTRGFVGGRQYAICLGLIKDGEVVVGALGCPNLPQAPLTDEDGTSSAQEGIGSPSFGVCFAAALGGGAYAGALSDPDTPSKAIRVADGCDPSKIRFMESYESRHSSQGVTSKLATAAGITEPPLRLDSQCKYGALSRGDAAVFLRFPPPSYREKIWDHAAGVLIANEAGAKVTDAKGDKLDFSKGRWLDLHKGIVAAPPAVHAKLLEACSRL